MPTYTATPRTQRCRDLLFGSKLERLLEWAEPIIRRVCLQVWRRYHPFGFEMEDLRQEARIEVYLQAETIMKAQDPEAMTAAIVRRRATKALKAMSDRHAWPRQECLAQTEADDPNSLHAPHAPL